MRKLDTGDKVILSLCAFNMVLTVLHGFTTDSLFMKIIGCIAICVYVWTASKLWLDEKPEAEKTE